MSQFANGATQSLLHPGGPRVVAIGGGHGLARTLGAARRYASAITAIVSVADDGGSSGRLRQALGIAAPGDIRRCLGALSSGEAPLSRTLEHRFDAGELEGHAFGNLLIAALVVSSGDFEMGIDEACRILGTVGAVFPATSCPVVLKAEAHGHALEGQVRIMGTEGITSVSIVPPDAPSPERAVRAILEADQIIIGPGSLYTSVLAALVPSDITGAVRRSDGTRIYLSNLREQVPETTGYDVGRHVAALVAHGISPDVVCADTSSIDLGDLDSGVRLVQGPLARANGLVHDEALLAGVLAGIGKD